MSRDNQGVGNVATSKCRDAAEDINYCLSLRVSLEKSAVISYLMILCCGVCMCVYVQASVCEKVMALSPWNRCPK